MQAGKDGKFTIIDSSGVITSPGYPEEYPNNAEYAWLIQLPPGQFIEVTFLTFELEKCLVITFFGWMDVNE